MSEYTLSLTILGKDKASGMFARLDQSLKSMLETAAGVSAARLFEDISAALGRLSIQAINAVAYMQNLDVVLTTLTAREMYMAGSFETVASAMGAAEEASGELMISLGKLAILSPYTTEAVTNMYRLMMAFGSTSEQSLRLTEGLMTMGAGLGASNEQIQRMAYNLAQIQLEGKVTALDIRQLALAGLPLVDVLQSVGRRFGLTINDHNDFNKALESGKITWEQFTQGFAEYADEHFGGAAERLSRTLAGLKSTFSDVFTLTIPRILGPAVEEITGIMSTLLDSFLYIYQDPRLAQIGEELGKKVSRWILPIKRAVERFTADIESGKLFEEAFETLFNNISTIMTMKFENALENFKKNSGETAGKLAEFIQNIFAGLATRMPKIGKFVTELFSAVMTTMATEAPNVLASVGEMWTTFAATLATSLPAIIAGLGKLGEGIAAGFGTYMPDLASAGVHIVATLLTGVVNALPGVLTGMLGVGVGIVTNLANSLVAAAPTLATTAASLIMQLISGINATLPVIFGAASQILNTLVAGLDANGPAIATAGISAIANFITGIVSLIPAILSIAGQLIMSLLNGLIQNMPTIMAAGMQAIVYLISGLSAMLPSLLVSAVELIFVFLLGIIQSLPQILMAGVQLVVYLLAGIVQSIPTIVAGAFQLMAEFVMAIISFMGTLFSTGAELAGALLQGILTGDFGPVQEKFAAAISGMSTNLSGWANENGGTIGSELIHGLEGGFLGSLPGTTTSMVNGVSVIEGGLSPALTNIGYSAGLQMTGGLQTGWDDNLPLFTGRLSSNMTLAGVTTGTDFTSGLENSLTSNAPGLNTAVEGMMTGVTDTMQSTVDLSMMNVGTSMTDNLALGLNNSWPALNTDMSDKLGTLTTDLTTQSTEMTQVGDTFVTSFSEGVNTAWPVFTTDVGTKLTTLETDVTTKTETIGLLGGVMVDNMTASFGEASPALLDASEALVGDVLLELEALKDTRYIGVAAIQGIIAGMLSKKQAAVDAAQELADAISGTLESTWIINSPSKVFAEIGKSVPEGIALGIGQSRDLPVSAAVQMARLLEESVHGIGNLGNPVAPVYNYNLTMPTSNSPADVKRAFDLLRAYGDNTI